MNLNSRSRAGRLRERFRAETREAILSAAEVALTEHGARGAKMEVIASAAGIAVGTLYNYFADRQELIDALIELRRRELIGRLDEALDGSPELVGETRSPRRLLPVQRAPEDEVLAFERQLQAFLGAGLAHFQAHRAFIALLMQEQLSSGHGSTWSTMQALRARAERLIAQGIDAGVLRPEDRATYPYMLVGLLKGLVEAAVTAANAETTELLGPAVRCFLQGARA